MMSKPDGNDVKDVAAPIRFSGPEMGTPASSALAAEIWLKELCEAPWCSRAAMRAGAFVSETIRIGCPPVVMFRDMESACNLSRDEIHLGLTLLKNFGCLEHYSSSEREVTIVARLSTLQRLRVLEMKERLDEIDRPRFAPPEPPSFERGADSERSPRSREFTVEQAMFSKALARSLIR